MKENTFGKNVATLMAGTGAAQVITFILAPIVTRIYSPDDFTSLEHYTMILSVLSVFSTFKMELSIIQAESDREALSLVKWCFRRSMWAALISLLLVIVFNAQIAAYFQNEHLRLFLYLIPLNLFLFGAYQSLIYWHHRYKKFSFTSFSKILFNFSNEGSKIPFGWAGIRPGGLIYSNVIARFLAVFYLFRKTSGELLFSEVKKEEEKEASRKFKDFYKFSVWGSFLGKLATWAHIFLFSHFFGVWSIGFFALSRRLILSPLSIFSQSFAQVFYQRISSLKEVKDIRQLFFKFFFILLGLAAVMVLVVLAVPNGFYSWALGDKWFILGDFMRILIFWFALNFVTSCLAFINYRLKKQRQMLVLDLLHFLIVVGSICIGFYSGQSEWDTLKLFVAGKILFFIINIIAMVYFVLTSDKFMTEEVSS